MKKIITNRQTIVVEYWVEVDVPDNEDYDMVKVFDDNFDCSNYSVIDVVENEYFEEDVY